MHSSGAARKKDHLHQWSAADQQQRSGRGHLVIGHQADNASLLFMGRRCLVQFRSAQAQFVDPAMTGSPHGQACDQAGYDSPSLGFQCVPMQMLRIQGGSNGSANRVVGTRSRDTAPCGCCTSGARPSITSKAPSVGRPVVRVPVLSKARTRRRRACSR